MGKKKRIKFRATYSQIEYKDAVRSAYRLGLQDGRDERQETVIAMRTAMSHLTEEIVRLDKVEPLDSIAVPFALVETVMRTLQKHQVIYSIKLLKECIERAGGSAMDILERCEKQ